jgi:hypothetical protein
MEVGASFNNLGLNSCDHLTDCDPIPPHNSFGPGITINFNKYWALDTTYDFTTGYEPLGNNFYPNGSVAGGRGSLALIGGRFNLRAANYGIFTYAKTGAVIWSGIHTEIVAPGTFFPSAVTYGEQAYFAIGAGAGVEYSPTPRVHVRASFGDLVADYRRDRFSGCSACFDGEGTAWVHNSDLNLGAYVGLGKPISNQRSELSTRSTHSLFDKTNVALMGVDILAQTSDAVGTQHFIHYGLQEQAGLARPLVDKGWPGQITVSAIGSSAGILAMYALHRMGHHRLERFLPLAAAAPSAYLGYRDLKNWGFYETH